MRRHIMRVFIAVLTFTFGISIFWFVDHFITVNNSDVSPVTLVRLNSDDDANEIYRLLVHRKFIFNDEVWGLGINYVIVRESDLPDGKFENFWERFYKKYPKSFGLMYFSKVGFNDRHDQAFVYVGRSCGGLCGAGKYVLLNKVNGEWVVTDEQGLWVS